MTDLEATVELLKPILEGAVRRIVEKAPPDTTAAQAGERMAEFTNAFIEKFVLSPKSQ